MGLRTDINFHARPSLNPPLRARVGAVRIQSRRKHTESKALAHALMCVYFLGECGLGKPQVHTQRGRMYLCLAGRRRDYMRVRTTAARAT